MLVIGILEASGVIKVSFPVWHVPLMFSYGEILLTSTCYGDINVALNLSRNYVFWPVWVENIIIYVIPLGPCFCCLFLEEGLPRKPQLVSHVVLCAEGCGRQGHPEAGPHADGCRSVQDPAAPQPQAAAVPAARRQSPRLQRPLIHAQLRRYYCFPCFFLYLFVIGSLSYQEPPDFNKFQTVF